MLAALGLIALPLAGCSAGTPGPPPKVTLSVVTANMANAADVDGLPWKDRIDRFAAAISANGPAPDIISMTESAGLWHCWVAPFRWADDYDLVDRLIFNLQASTGVRYRVAYLTGVEGKITNSLGTEHCSYYTGDTLLYNPARLTNLTPDDVAGRPQVGHVDPLLGFQVRRSLPLCVRGSNLEPLDILIDGPAQTERCNLKTHSGPAWAQVDLNLEGHHTLVATLARFALIDIPGSSFDLFTIHPQAGHDGAEELLHKEPINSFVRALTGPAYRTSAPYWPAIIVGDYNSLDNDPNWPDHTTQVAREMQGGHGGAMAVNTGSGLGLPAARGLQLDSAVMLPNEDPCTGPGSTGGFSDHCGMLVRFSTTP
jgi:hypothetical protein